MGAEHERRPTRAANTERSSLPSKTTPGKTSASQELEPGRAGWHGKAYRGSVFNGSVPWSGQAEKLDDEVVELAAILAGLRAAEHAVDSAVDPAHAPAKCEEAIQHLLHVSNAVATFDGDGKEQAACDAADSFAASLERLRARAPEAIPLRLHVLNTLIRRDLGLNSTPAPGIASRNEAAPDKSYVRNAIPSALQLVAVRARAGVAALESDPPQSSTRDTRVAALADELDASSRYARSLLGQLTFEERQAFVQDVQIAAAEVQVLVRWVRTRTPHKAMEQRLHTAVGSFDAVLRSVGLAVTDNRAAATLSEGSQQKAEHEEADVAAAAETLTAAIATLEAAQLRAVTTFDDIARLEDVVQPSLVETILKAVLSATMGYLFGELIKVVTTAKAATPEAPAEMVNEPLRALFTVGLNTASTSIQTAWAQAAKDNSIGLARIVFSSAMRHDIQAKAGAYRKRVTALKLESGTSAAEFRAMGVVVEQSAVEVMRTYVQRLAHDWASYLARSNLRTRADGTANMRDYFGVPKEGGREFGTSKQATPGVMQLLMVVDRTTRIPRQDTAATKIVGLNSQLMGSVLDDVKHDLTKVRLPKELHVHAEFGRAIIAVDERNRFQDAIHWEQVHREVGVTAHQFWKIYGGRLTLT